MYRHYYKQGRFGNGHYEASLTIDIPQSVLDGFERLTVRRRNSNNNNNDQQSLEEWEVIDIPDDYGESKEPCHNDTENSSETSRNGTTIACAEEEKEEEERQPEEENEEAGEKEKEGEKQQRKQQKEQEEIDEEETPQITTQHAPFEEIPTDDDLHPCPTCHGYHYTTPYRDAHKCIYLLPFPGWVSYHHTYLSSLRMTGETFEDVADVADLDVRCVVEGEPEPEFVPGSRLRGERMTKSGREMVEAILGGIGEEEEESEDESAP